MPLMRSTWFYKDQNGYGWSETIYNTAPNHTALIALANTLLPRRVALLGTGASLNEIRISDDLIRRDSQVIIVSPADGVQKGISSSNLASDDIVCRIEGTSNLAPPFSIRRTLALRGTPISITTQAGAMNLDLDENWLAQFKRYASQLIRDGWAIRFRDPTVPVFGISGAVQAPLTGIVTVTTSLPHGLIVGDGVQIKNTVGSVQLNGAWRVLTVPSGNSFTVLLFQLMGTYVGGGTVNKFPYLLAPISAVIPIRCASHKAGRPFDAPRGRRRARARK